jgi:hypothetical protein
MGVRTGIQIRKSRCPGPAGSEKIFLKIRLIASSSKIVIAITELVLAVRLFTQAFISLF